MPLIIAHAEDPDGIIARSLMMRKFSLGGRDHKEHSFVRYDRIIEAFEEAITKAKDCDSVYVADVNPNPRLVQAGSDFTLLEKLAQGREVYWFDHHDGTLRHQEKLAELGFKVYHQEKQCAALIIAQHNGLLNSPYDLRLAKIAQAHDHKNTSSEHENIQIGNELEKIIALANEGVNYDLLLDLSCALRDEQCFDDRWNLLPHWENYADQFTVREKAAYQELDETVEIERVGEHRVLFGYSSPLLSQKPGSFYLRQKYEDQAEIFVCLFRAPVRNQIILSNPSCTFPVVPFVQSLGGGGRGNGGGFTLDYDITSANYTKVKDMIISEIERYSQ